MVLSPDYYCKVMGIHFKVEHALKIGKDLIIVAIYIIFWYTEYNRMYREKAC